MSKNVKDLSTSLQDWRIQQTLLLSARGKSQAAIARELKVSESTTSRDIHYLKGRAKENITKYMNEDLPLQFELTLSGLNQIIENAWTSIEKIEDYRVKCVYHELLMQAYNMRLDLLSNVELLSQAVRFVDKYNNNNNETIQTKP